MWTGRIGVFHSIFCCTLASIGCSADVKTAEVHPSDTNLATVGRLYAQAEQKLGRPPSGMDDLKPFLPAGTDLNQILISPTDSQPYVIVWGTKVFSTADQSLIFAYEKTGANGLRKVLTPAGMRMLSSDDFAKSVFPPGHKPDIR